MNSVYVVTTVSNHGKHPIVKVFSTKDKAEKWAKFMEELLWEVDLKYCEVDDWNE